MFKTIERMLVKTEELLSDLRKATPTRTGHITFPLLGRDPSGNVGISRDPSGVKGDPQQHFYPVADRPRTEVPFVPPSKVGDRWRRMDVLQGQQLASAHPSTALAIFERIKKRKQEAIQEGHNVESMYRLIPSLPRASGAMISIGGHKQGKVQSTGYATVGEMKDPDLKQAAMRSVNATQAHEAHHDIVAQLARLDTRFGGPLYEHLGSNMMKRVIQQRYAATTPEEARNHDIQFGILQTMKNLGTRYGVPPFTSPFEEMFAAMHKLLYGP